MHPLAVDIAGRQLEAAGVVARLEDGREIEVSLADIRKALAAEMQEATLPQSDPTLEAAE